VSKVKRAPTAAKQWKSKGTSAIEVPSGNVALVRRKSLVAFIKAGTIPNALLPIITKAIAEGEDTMNPREIFQDLGRIDDIVELIDSVVIECAINPKVYPVPADDEERDEDLLYVDELDEMDKLFVYQFVIGGTKDLEKFRAEQASALAAFSSGGEVRSEAEQTAGDRG
jgi:hypothetical protein